MTSGIARLYALVGTVAVFFVAWALIAAHPWQTQATAATDPRLAQLASREQQLRQEAARVQHVVERRFAVYRARLKERKRALAAQAAQAQPAPVATPAVQVVTLPPITATRSS